MNYEQKYLKYKSKYLQAKTNQSYNVIKGGFNPIILEGYQHLFKKKQICSLRINGNKIIGTISHVNDQGLMVVIQNGVEYTYQVGEIEWLF
jgi:biotin-(acetyl-CoA carboxylase) ligase